MIFDPHNGWRNKVSYRLAMILPRRVRHYCTIIVGAQHSTSPHTTIGEVLAESWSELPG